MEDIAPLLLKKIKDDYSNMVAADSWTQAMLDRVKNKTATTDDASLLARTLGEKASQALVNNLTEDVLPNGVLYYNIAEKTVAPVLESVWKESNNVSIKVQNAVNKASGDVLKAVSGEYPTERIESIISAATAEGIEFTETQRILGEPVANTCQGFYDDFVKTNARKVSRSGTSGATITRTAEAGACKWCRNLAGSWDYYDKPDNIFRRHDNCRCTVTYKKGTKAQDVWSKATWQEDEDRVVSILNKEKYLAEQERTRSIARTQKAKAMEVIFRELHYNSRAASIFYNSNKEAIERYGIDYVIDYNRNWTGRFVDHKIGG